MNYKPKNFKYGEIITESDLNNTETVELIAISTDIPENMQNGDNYYNSNDNLIYTMINDELNDGEEPIEGVIYVLVAEETLYYYNGSTLISVGGGKPEVVIQEEQPTEEQNATIWIDTGEINNLGSEVVNTLSGNETNLAPSVRAVKNLNEYSGNDTIAGYLDNDVPVYRRFITYNGFHGAPLLDNVTNLLGASGMVFLANVWRLFPYSETFQGQEYLASLEFDGATSTINGKFLQSGNPVNNVPLRIVVYYTKTTD